jgi:regulator of protease activity HflC (stomatin/prohibitin superfamily)
MDASSAIGSIILIIILIIVLIGILKSFYTVPQGNIAVITRFGKLKNISEPGLHFKTPYIDVLATLVSTQNRTAEVKLQAITVDQANVYFNAMILYAVADSNLETIKNVTFKFRSTSEFNMALVKCIEGSIRGFVSTKRQSEVLQLRTEIVSHIKGELDARLLEWGYHLHDLQINDITFDEEIMQSMAKVVSSSNLKAAAENEGQALLIQMTKKAEAEGNAIKISAQAEKEASQLRGEGIAAFRKSIAEGLKDSMNTLHDVSNGAEIILAQMWIDGLMKIAEQGKGNMIFFDGTVNGLHDTIKQFKALQTLGSEPSKS